MQYFKRYWSQNRDDEYSNWGGATYIFEVDETYFPIRQTEIYDNDFALKYNKRYSKDRYGGLRKVALEKDGWKVYEILQSEFEDIWSSLVSRNVFDAVGRYRHRIYKDRNYPVGEEIRQAYPIDAEVEIFYPTSSHKSPAIVTGYHFHSDSTVEGIIVNLLDDSSTELTIFCTYLNKDGSGTHLLTGFEDEFELWRYISSIGTFILVGGLWSGLRGCGVASAIKHHGTSR